MPMNLEIAIKTAMEMELKIRDLYTEALETCPDKIGKRFFAMMQGDEQYHHDYLEKRLTELSETGGIQYQDDIRLNVPSREEIAACVQQAHESMTAEARGVVQQMLSNALRVEVLTSEFYDKMVSETQGTAKRMFERFLEIENGHIAAVQAELDYVMNTGYWFDFKEFDME